MNPRRLYSIPLPGRAPLQLGARTFVMGILNVTPDSFADGGVHFDVDRAVEAGGGMGGDGADIVDVGGGSTRPRAEPLPGEGEGRGGLPGVGSPAARVDRARSN